MSNSHYFEIGDNREVMVISHDYWKPRHWSFWPVAVAIEPLRIVSALATCGSYCYSRAVKRHWMRSYNLPLWYMDKVAKYFGCPRYHDKALHRCPTGHLTLREMLEMTAAVCVVAALSTLTLAIVSAQYSITLTDHEER